MDKKKSVKLVSISPNAEQLILETARVSSDPAKQNTGTGLLKYLINHGHWSPFEMANMVVEIHTTRDIARQLLRHRSFSFQEFSQRYQDTAVLSDEFIPRKAREQDPKNRQNSIVIDDELDRRVVAFETLQQEVWTLAMKNYRTALGMGIAKEQARVMLPEGLTPTRLYMNGNIRSWIHYLQLRTGNGTQAEHVEIAQAILDIFKREMPMIGAAFGGSGTSAILFGAASGGSGTSAIQMAQDGAAFGGSQSINKLV